MNIVIALIVPNGASKELHRYGPNAIRLPRVGEIVDLSPKDDCITGIVRNIIHFPNRNPQETWVYISQK